MAEGGCAIGLDPGTSKCGLARSDDNQQQLDLCLTCTPHECWKYLQDWWLERQPAVLYLGDGTRSTRWRLALLTWCPPQALRDARLLHHSRQTVARTRKLYSPPTSNWWSQRRRKRSNASSINARPKEGSTHSFPSRQCQWKTQANSPAQTRPLQRPD